MAVFAWLDWLGLGENDEDTIDPQGSVQRAKMFMSVTPTPHYLIPPKTFQRP